MWVEGGFPPETFWRQTQRSFTNALTGAAKRSTTEAWRAANLTAAASVGKLPSLGGLLSPLSGEPSPAAISADLLHFMRRLQARGVPVKIERLN